MVLPYSWIHIWSRNDVYPRKLWSTTKWWFSSFSCKKQFFGLPVPSWQTFVSQIVTCQILCPPVNKHTTPMNYYKRCRDVCKTINCISISQICFHKNKLWPMRLRYIYVNINFYIRCGILKFPKMYSSTIYKLKNKLHTMGKIHKIESAQFLIFPLICIVP